VVENGLSLCSLHHKVFDLGAIAISDEYKVLVSRDFRGGGEWVARFLRSAVPLSWDRKRASLRSVRSLRRGTARRCTAGRIVGREVEE
jgi:hypothetical protein